MGNVRVSDTSGRHHNAGTLTYGWGLVQTSATRLAHTRAALAEYTEVEVLGVATKPIHTVSAQLLNGADPYGVIHHRGPSALGRHAGISDYWMLTKPEINFLIAIATLTGFYLALPHHFDHFPLLLLVHTLLGTLLVASGTGTLHQYIERYFDAQMRRTARRPLAAGRLTPSVVLWFGVALSAVGSVYLAICVNVLTSLLTIMTLFSYLFVYTPLKRKTPLCIAVGAFPGAIPPLIGWAAASGMLSFE